MKKTDKINILVIDDSRTVCKIISEPLIKHGYNVTTATNMEDGLIIWGHSKIDIILTDLILPGLSGVEGIRIIREKSKEVMIIAMSAGAYQDDSVNLLGQARQMGADAVLKKPFTDDVLLKKLENEIDFTRQFGHKKRALVIDDSSTICMVVTRMLDKMGYATASASSVEDAFENKDILGLDLVITDIYMPGKGGIQGIMELREMWPSIKIVAMSGGNKSSAAGKTLEAARMIGADLSITKPFNEVELSFTLESLFQTTFGDVGLQLNGELAMEA